MYNGLCFKKRDKHDFLPNSWELDTSSNAATKTTARNAWAVGKSCNNPFFPTWCMASGVYHLKLNFGRCVTLEFWTPHTAAICTNIF